jgi:hypothetical protein
MSKAYLAHSAKTPQAALSPGKLEYGGLTEEDAISARPDFDATAGKPQRVNDVRIYCVLVLMMPIFSPACRGQFQLRHRRHADQGTRTRGSTACSQASYSPKG